MRAHDQLREKLLAAGFKAAAETAHELPDPEFALACWERPALGLCDWPRIQDNAWLATLSPREFEAEMARRRENRMGAEAA